MGASRAEFLAWRLAWAQFELTQVKPGSIASRDAMRAVKEAWADVEDLQTSKPTATPGAETPEAIVQAVLEAMPGWRDDWLEAILFRAAEVLEIDLTPALDAHHKVGP